MHKNIKHIFAASSGLVCFIVYLLTLHPSVGFIDCGELAAVCYTFGVPHPTGYPLFLVLGFIFSHLPFPGTVIYKLNLLSAIESAAAVTITFYSAVLILEKLMPDLLKSKQNPKGHKNVKKEPHLTAHTQAKAGGMQIYSIAFFAAVLSGLTKTFWFEATQVEVYALHSLFISMLVYLCLKVFFNIKAPVKKYWALLFLFFGLSAANHSTTIYFIPGIIYLFYHQYKANKAFAKSALVYLLLLLPGALMYLILIVVASNQPYFNWSNPVNLENLINHLRGSDFSQLMFSSSANFSNNASAFFKGLPAEMAILPGLVGLAGLAALWKVNKSLLGFCLMLILTSLLYSFNYNTIEINSFYLVVYYIIILFSAVGIVFLVNFTKQGLLAGNKPSPAIIILGIALCAVSIGYNYKENNNSANYVNEDVTVNTLNLLEPNAILFTYDYAFVYSTSLYFQQVEKLRADVKVFIIKFIAAPWYLEMIRKYYPDVYDNVRTEADEYINAYKGDEKTRIMKLSALVKAFIDKSFKKFPVYMTIDFVLDKDLKKLLPAYTLQPEGLVYRLKEQKAEYNPNAGVISLNAKFRSYEPVGYHKNRMFITTAGMFFQTANYHYNNKNNDLALKFLDKTLELNNNFSDAVKLKNKILPERK